MLMSTKETRVDEIAMDLLSNLAVLSVSTGILAVHLASMQIV